MNTVCTPLMLSLDKSRETSSAGAFSTTTMGSGGGIRYFQYLACALTVAWIDATALLVLIDCLNIYFFASSHLLSGGTLLKVPKSSSGILSPSSVLTQAAMDLLMDVRLYPPCVHEMFADEMRLLGKKRVPQGPQSLCRQPVPSACVSGWRIRAESTRTHPNAQNEDICNQACIEPTSGSPMAASKPAEMSTRSGLNSHAIGMSTCVQASMYLRPGVLIGRDINTD